MCDHTGTLLQLLINVLCRQLLRLLNGLLYLHICHEFAQAPVALSGHSATSLGSQIVVIGGRGQSRVLCCDISEDCWREAPLLLPHELVGHTAVLVGTVIVVAEVGRPLLLLSLVSREQSDWKLAAWEPGC